MNLKAPFQFGLLMSALTMANVCFAAESNSTSKNVPSPAKIATLRDLDALRSQNALLTEALKNAELKAKLEGNGVRAPGLENKSGGTPIVMLVSGSSGQLSATVAMPSGGQIHVKVGSKIVGYGTVQSISSNEVIVLNRNELISLPFAGETGFAMGGGR